VAVVTKVDLASAVEFSWETAYNDIQSVRPGMPVFKVSAKTGQGMEEHLQFLGASLTELRQSAAVCQMSESTQ
jgi:hydrogenase nickel incorporation protein HypB